jgi:hypothetical protein
LQDRGRCAASYHYSSKEVISNKTMACVAVAYMIAAVTFLCVGDAFNVNWYAFFFETELFLALLLLIFVRGIVKNIVYKRIFEVVIAWKVFYIVFNIAVLFKPFDSYRDFTSNPVVCVQILWCIIGFSLFQIYRK